MNSVGMQSLYGGGKGKTEAIPYRTYLLFLDMHEICTKS
jgi:hypothetical protein